MPAEIVGEERDKIEGELLLALTDGLNRTDACACAGISMTTLRKWIDEDPQFEKYIRLAEVKCKRYHLRKIGNGDPAWKASAWLLERKWWQEFGIQKQEQEDDKRMIRIRKVVVNTSPATPDVPEALPKEAPAVQG